jgi:CRP-like cAMP-binding protein
MLSDRLGAASEIERSYAAGDVIVREGDPGTEMFVIRSGEVSIHRQGREIARRHQGDFFGEMSVLESMPREADVVAETDTRVLVLGPGALLVRIRRDPSFALELMRALSAKVRQQNAT